MKKILFSLLLVFPALSFAQVAKHNGGVSTTYGLANYVQYPTESRAISLTSASNVLWGDGSHLTGISSGTISGLTTNTIPKATAANAIGNSGITDSGSVIAIPYKMTVAHSSGNGIEVTRNAKTLSLNANNASGDVYSLIGMTAGMALSFIEGSNNTFYSSYSSGTLVGPGLASLARLQVLPIAKDTYSLLISSQNNTTHIFAVLPNGNVGVGTTSPESKFTVNGVILSTGTSPTVSLSAAVGNANISFTGPNATNPAAILYTPADGNVSIRNVSGPANTITFPYAGATTGGALCLNASKVLSKCTTAVDASGNCTCP